MASERLDVILSLITGNYKREAREAATATGQIAGKAKETGGAVTSMGDKFNAARAKFAALAGAGIALGAAFGSAIRAASDLGESINAVEKVFGGSSDIIENFGQVSANAVGLSTREFNQLATVTGGFLQNLGYNSQNAARETVTLTQRASDMASVFNTDVGTALSAINSALKGEFNPIEQFAVKLSDADVRARAVALGLAETTAAVDTNAKAVATLDLIYERTSKTQGDFASTSDDLANSQRRAAAAFENAQARFGKAITPIAATLVDRFAEGIERIAAAFGDAGARKSIIFNEAITAINKEMEAGTLDTNDLADALRHLAENSDLTASDFETLAAMVGLSADQFGVFSESVIAEAEAMGLPAQVVEELRLAMEGLGPAAEGTVDPLAASAEAAKKNRDRLHELADAQRNATQAFLESANPAIQATAAIQRYQEAQKKLDDVLKDVESTEYDVAEAQLEVVRTALEAQGALDAFSAANPQAQIQLIADVLGISDDAARDLLETLGLIDGTQVSVVFNYSTRTTADAAEQAAGQYVPPAYRPPSSNTNTIDFRQHGGAVYAGRPYMVGENGMEMFIPQRSGMVLSTAATRQLLAGMRAGGGDWNINLNGVHTVDRGAIDLLGTMAGVQRRVEARR